MPVRKLLIPVLYALIVTPMAAQSGDAEQEEGFRWASALGQSGEFLAIQHGFRLATEPQTRADLKGPFIRDYFRSVTSIKWWNDGDPAIVNYVGHPMEGAVAGFIEIQNDPRFRRAEFGRSGRYWKSRMRAMAFSAAYSAQFELGPFSEASLGNVQRVPGCEGVVDLVITPLLGTGWTIAEDALDRYLVRRVEEWTDGRGWRLVARSVLNPGRSFANMLRFKVPWHRDSRPGVSFP